MSLPAKTLCINPNTLFFYKDNNFMEISNKWCFFLTNFMGSLSIKITSFVKTTLPANSLEISSIDTWSKINTIMFLSN